MLGVLCVKVGTLIAITGAYIGGHAGCIVYEGRYLDCNNGCLYRWACWVYCV